MEQSLLEKLHNGTMDAIDKDMLVARLRNACTKFAETIDECTEKMSKIIDEYEDEAKLMGISCIMFMQTKAFHKNDAEIDCEYIFGKSNYLHSVLDKIKGELK